MLDELISNTPIGGFTTKVKSAPDGDRFPFFLPLGHGETLFRAPIVMIRLKRQRPQDQSRQEA
jgi:hypothetical protein